MAEPTTYTPDVPGARLSYDIRPNNSSRASTLLLIGGEYGQTGEPEAFAATLRSVLDEEVRS